MNLFSKMSGKLKDIPAINTSPFSNPFCTRQVSSNSICAHCYSKRMLTTFRSLCVPKFEKNSELLSSRALEEVPRVNYAYVRINAHGEFINRQHVENVYRIATANPNTTFAIWTKRPQLLHGLVKPHNVILIYSSPVINKIAKIPCGFDKVFTVFTQKYQDKVDINCHGKCFECLLCYTKNNVVYVNKLLK